MKIYMDPLPKTCSTCNLGRRVLEYNPWYTCFITGKTCTSITTDRPEWCPIQEPQLKKREEKSQNDSSSLLNVMNRT